MQYTRIACIFLSLLTTLSQLSATSKNRSNSNTTNKTTTKKYKTNNNHSPSKETSQASTASTSTTNKTPNKNTATGTTALQLISNNIQQIFTNNKYSVVKVISVSSDNSNNKNLTFNSGFFIDNDGYLATSANALKNASQIWIEVNKIAYSCEMMGSDEISNVAVLKVQTKPVNIKGIASENHTKYFLPEIGQILVSIGSTAGMEIAPSSGLTQGTNLTFGENIFASSYIRASIPLYGGESGSAVFYANGKFCGMIIAAIPECNSSFILPASALFKITSTLINKKQMEYCSAGFGAVEQLNDNNQREIVVTQIVNDSEAEKVGLKINDIISSIDDNPITDVHQIADTLVMKNVGDTIAVKVLRPKTGQNSQSNTNKQNSQQCYDTFTFNIKLAKRTK